MLRIKSTIYLTGQVNFQISIFKFPNFQPLRRFTRKKISVGNRSQGLKSSNPNNLNSKFQTYNGNNI